MLSEVDVSHETTMPMVAMAKGMDPRFAALEGLKDKEALLGLGRMAALHHRLSALYQIH
jgi:hypothetical protein